MPRRQPDRETFGSTDIGAHGATIAEVQDALTAGTLSSADLAACNLDRIGRLDPQLRAVIAVSPAAGDEAQASDRARAAGAARCPLDGVPVLIKVGVSHPLCA
jgi:Asp-tRNA(Asn)/Glu-tRNA(Gln) amidotransferase A subunit family amidase